MLIQRNRVRRRRDNEPKKPGSFPLSDPVPLYDDDTESGKTIGLTQRRGGAERKERRNAAAAAFLPLFSLRVSASLREACSFFGSDMSNGLFRIRDSSPECVQITRDLHRFSQ
jgi:hypothetical protein